MGRIIVEKCNRCGLIKSGTQKWYHFIKWDLCYGHDRRISELEPMKASEIQEEDMIPIVDTSERQTKRVSVGVLREWINGRGY